MTDVNTKSRNIIIDICWLIPLFFFFNICLHKISSYVLYPIVLHLSRILVSDHFIMSLLLFNIK